MRGAELIIHNAPFDIGFINAELARLDMAPIETVCRGVIDSLRLAKDLHPGKKNNLDVLCDRYGIDNSKRTLHGALLDAEILADVYIAMTRGQESLIMEADEGAPAQQDVTTVEALAPGQTPDTHCALRIQRADETEQLEHAQLLAAIQKESKGKCLWLADSGNID